MGVITEERHHPVVHVRRLFQLPKNQHFDRVEGITAESLNDHYSQISTDRDYTPSALKQTVVYPNNDFFQNGEFLIFWIRSIQELPG